MVSCPFCGVESNDWMINMLTGRPKIEFFECGNVYDVVLDKWLDICCSEPRWPQ